jgi:polygalacturonase
MLITDTEFGASMDSPNNVRAIQAAIDSCGTNGTVIIPRGTFRSGMLKLRSNMTLRFEEGAVLQGTRDFVDYKNATNPFENAFLYAADADNIIIEGPGIIDGMGCTNEEGADISIDELDTVTFFQRGPHIIRFTNCKKLVFKDITFFRSGHYSMYLIDCDDVVVDNITADGGYDGIHSQRGRNLKVTGSAFYTRDDCIAGSDNVDVHFTDCIFNSNNIAFRFGCRNLLVEHSRIYAPGKYSMPRGSDTYEAFVHFAPPRRKSSIPSDNWLIRDIIVENMKSLYSANIREEEWQQGQPVLNINFENVKASGLFGPVFVRDNFGARNARLRFKNCDFSFKPGADCQFMIQAACFDIIELDNVVMKCNNTTRNKINIREGNELILRGLNKADKDIATHNILNGISRYDV